MYILLYVYILFFFSQVHILQEDTNHFNSEHSGFGNQFINFSESYHKIAGEENYKNSKLNEIIAHNIYDNIKNNINYIKETQYNSCQDISTINSDNNHSDKNKEGKHNYECLNNNISLRNNIKFTNSKADSHNETHNILKNDINNLEIHQYIPYISSTEFLEQNKKSKEINNLYQTYETMNDPRYNDYPPMNGFGYNHNNMSNQNGFYTNTYNKELANLTMQQHNMHGRNNLMFEDGNIPYGLYDQSNYTGTNSVMCGNGISNEPKMMYRRNEMNNPPYYHNYPMNNGMGYNEHIVPAMQYNPNMRKHMMRNGYSHECNYMNSRPNYPTPKNNMDITSEKNYKKDNCRKNISKIKKGDIDINIETSSSSKKGVIIDLNIGVGN